MTASTPPPARWYAHRLLRGYGPLVAFVVVFLLMAVLVPTIDQETTSGAGDPAGVTGPLTGSAGQPSTGAGSGVGGTAPGDGAAAGPGSAGGAGTSPATGGAVPARATPPPPEGTCPDRDKQVPGDPYSPPCVAWAGGDNGGATSRGVTGTEIVVAARTLQEKGFQQTLAALAGASIQDSPEDIQRTIAALADYFNSRFHFYGRTLRIAFHAGKGSEVNELLGGGQAEAEADAVTVAEEIGAFAEIRGATPPYTDALARRKVVAFGTPYLSREWHQKRRPYNWSIDTDCSIIVEAVASLSLKYLGGKRAEYAGPALQDDRRRFAALAPENPWYQECVDSGQRIATAGGHPFDVRIAYKLDIPSMSNQAANIIAKLKSEGITTVLCGCDPIFPVFLSSKAAEQDYHPEWVVTGTAQTDEDKVGQLNDQGQWARAFGISYQGAFRPLRAGLGYSAYKAVRDDEPAFDVEAIYGQMYMLVIGIHMAGPNLTPDTYEQGMFAYPGGTGPFGTWGFGPDNYTPTQDLRVIWWDPEGTSPFNNKKGTFVESFGGARFPHTTLPDEPPDLFTR